MSLSSSSSSKSSRKSSFEDSIDLESARDVDENKGPSDAPTPAPDNEKAEQLPPVDDWDGDNDPENPYCWPKWKRWYHTFIPAGIALVCTLASSIYVPGREDVMRDFGVSPTVAILPYSIYVLALAVGPMLAGPSSEVLGRRAVYLVSIPIFALFILGSGFSNNIASLVVCRFFAGVFGSPGLSIGSATVADVWRPHERAIPMSLYILTPFLGPALGPMLGGYATVAYGWRWTQWVLLFFTIFFLLPAFGMQETFKAKILQSRATRLGLALPGKQKSTLESAKFFLTTQLTRPIHMGLTEPIVGLFTLYIAVNFAMLYSFFAVFEGIMRDVYGFGLGQSGLTFLGLGAGCIFGCAIIIILNKTLVKKQVRISKENGQGGKIDPESRLYIAMAGSLFIPVSLFWFAWTARSDVHWISPVIAEAFFGCGNLFIFMAATLYLTDTYGAKYTASAMGANNLARYTVGCVFPLWVNHMYNGLGIGWATSLFGFISVVMMPIPWVFWLYGPRLRANVKYKP
jgi:multidrug resistance protein